MLVIAFIVTFVFGMVVGVAAECLMIAAGNNRTSTIAMRTDDRQADTVLLEEK